jgi:aspartyl-tRNA(Asn)/glutamyl-tRNA(Gln) amidotransferase subunit B
MNWEPVIGLEIHAQLSSNTKVWCNCEINTRAFENTKVCEVCSAQPGTLPYLNQKAVNYALMASIALNCKVNKFSKFDRKNYFYPDLPKGFQITQFDIPVGENGYLEIKDSEGKIKKVGIERVQMEEDTGKSIHSGNSSLINLNRAGTPLIEIVGKPDIKTAKEASGYFKNIQSILTYLGVCDGNMQDGNLRCDVNLSLRKKGTEKFGTRTEVKNLNSFRSVERAIEHEMQRQAKILDDGGQVEQQTLLFDVDTGKTRVLRTKSDADDYRYFPEPDLMPLIVTDKYIEDIKKNLPELPVEKVKRFITEYKIPEYDAEVLSADKELADYYEEAMKNYNGDAKKMSNWIMVELLRFLNESSTPVSKSPIQASEMANLLKFIDDGKISGKQAKEVILDMYDNKSSASDSIKKLGVEQISDTSALEAIAQKIVDDNPDQVEKYLSGKDRVFGFFVGQVMKETKGQANPGMVAKILKEIIKK